MALQKAIVSTTEQIPVYQKINETAQGGYLLDITGLTTGAVIRKGTPFTYNETTRKAKPATVTPGVDDDPDTSDARGTLLHDAIVQDDERVDIVIDGTIYERRIKADHSDVDAAHKEALRGLIKFDKSF